jgi:hypothetical protein
LNAGQRVDAVRRLAAAMSDLPYSEIDLILKQFGAPWSDSWDGTVNGYLVHHLGEASDEALSGLLAYFDGTSPPEAAPAVWSGDSFRLFLSHSSVDKAFVSEFKSELRKYGIEGFVAHEDIEPTAEWLKSILGALDTCDALAALLTDDFRSSTWCDQEVGHAIGMRKLIVPLARGCMPYGFMGRYQALKCAEADAGELARQMAEILIANPLTSARLAESLIENLERSDSFLEAKANMALVNRIKTWTPPMLRRLEGCVKNYQVSHAFGVPEAIKRILNDHSSPQVDDEEVIPF